MQTTIKNLSQEELNSLEQNEKFRNQVAYAHGCYNSKHEFKYLKTCAYPESSARIVTEEQKQKALDMIERKRTEVLERNKDKLLFVAMGMNYDERYPDDVCNHRIRTEFVNRNGQIFFLEVGTGRGEEMRVDFAIDRSRQINENTTDVGYNYNGLERQQHNIKYTKSNLIEWVNRQFDCDFKEIVIDKYNLTSPKEWICCSPSFIK